MKRYDANPDDKIIQKHFLFAGLIILTSVVFLKPLELIVRYALNNESASHIILIPAVSFYLLFTERRRIFRAATSVIGTSSVVALLGLILLSALLRNFLPLQESEPPSLAALSLMFLWIAGFYFCYGTTVFRAALFPLSFLILAVPLPTSVLDQVVTWLQEGSTTITEGIFKLAGVPVFRQGFLLTVPGVTIEVARECSGIRSSMALLITCLLAAHMYLKTWWKMLLFVTLVLPWSILKNGIRIATLTLLSLYVNPGFLHGDLHRDGGVVFFLIALAGLLPVLILLHRSEIKSPTGFHGSPLQPGTTSR